MNVKMIKSINIVIRNLRCLILLLLSVVCIQSVASESEDTYPEKTVDGIRYFKKTRLIKYRYGYPDMASLRMYGFSINPNEEGTFIAPDGKIVPRFDDILEVVPLYYPNPKEEWQDCPRPSYCGSIYIPDKIEDFTEGQDLFVLDFYHIAMGEYLTAVRTPIYTSIGMKSFSNASFMEKIQIGACYNIEWYSFVYCLKLETVIFEQAPFVQKYAFTDCIRIKDIVLLSETELPLLEGASAFPECVYNNATVYVPDNLMAAFKSDPVWSLFTNVKSLKECQVEIMKQ